MKNRNFSKYLVILAILVVCVKTQDLKLAINNLRINLIQKDFNYHNVVSLDVSADELKDYNVVNFDQFYNVIENGNQEDLNADDIILVYGDFYHHDTNSFKYLTRNLVEGDVVILNNMVWVVEGSELGKFIDEPGSLKDGLIYDSNGQIIQHDNKIQIIQCYDDSPESNRYIITIAPFKTK